MLYKYVKKPINLSKPDKKTKYKTKIKVNNIKEFLFISALVLIITIYLSIYIYPYIQQNLNTSNLEKSIILVNDELAKSEENRVLGESKNFTYINNVSRTIAYASSEINRYNLINPNLEYITGNMYLSIPKLNLNNLPIRINVDSTNEKVYLPILEKELAHFKGTSLPGYKGNIFVYGHSVNEIWAKINPRNPYVAFTYLKNLDIGDQIILNYQDKKYEYIVYKTKIVPPDDVTPIFTIEEDNTLTLMTCWPPGIGNDRLIVVAKEI